MTIHSQQADISHLFQVIKSYAKFSATPKYMTYN